MISRRESFLTWLALAAVSFAQAQAPADEKRTPVAGWAAAGEFPLVAWGGPPSAFNTRENWKTVKDGGFTLGLSGSAVVAENRKALDICKELRLPILVIDSRINPDMTAKPGWRKTIAETIADYSPHPALYGFYGWDEPASDLFARLGAMNDEFRKRAPNLLFHLNLFPTYATPEQLGTPTYREHVEKFLSTVKPQLLSFDHYALLANGTVRPDYYENLATIRQCALNSGLAPWMFILSIKHCAYADPSESQMHWQAYTALAYGMKGILYFVYWPYEALGSSAIVDLKGKPTRLYPIVKRLNGEIRAIGKTLLTLTSTGVYHTGPIPSGGTRLRLDAPLQLPADKSLVIGFFEDPGKTQYALIANADPNHAVDFAITLHAEVKRLLAISPASGAASPVELKGNQAAYRLAAGSGRLFRLETAFKYPEPKKVER
jgi:hypothetical protein